MANSFQGITDLKVKFRLEGFERLQGLGKQLVKIQGIAGKTDRDFLKLFTDIKKFAAESATTENSLRGQIGSFKRLRDSLDITGKSYRTVNDEIRALNNQLLAVKQNADKGPSAKQMMGRILGTKPSTFKELLGTTMKDNPLSELAVTSEAYATALVRTEVLQKKFNARLAQTEAIARRMAGMHQDALGFPLEKGESKRNIGQTEGELDFMFSEKTHGMTWDKARTRSGFQTRIDIYEQQLQDLTIGSDKEKKLVEKIRTVRRELVQSLAAGAPGSINVGIDSLRDSRSEFKYGLLGGKNIKDVGQEILAASKQGTKSIRNLQTQRDLWMQLRNAVSINSPAFANITERIKKLDDQLARANKTGGRFQGTLSAMGGLLTAGLFGGPAGLVGGLGALGVGRMRGMEGPALAATIGSAGLITSQIARPIGQAIGGSATYSADITKSQIALRTATEVKDAEGRVDAVASLKSYEQAIRAAAFATDELNIPQEVAAKGMTRLSAAVIGAGGNVNNAAEAFINITAAIKGTGGNAEDVKSAITAMVQIFSKGKVSAEELSGQLGERFPAAVTRFAKANKMNTIDLQKGLKAGTVGLDMLSKFVESLGEDFLPVARAIADSTEEAGARGTVAINKLRLEFGKLIQPLGAKFQELGVKILTSIGPPIVQVGKIAGAVFLGLANGISFVVDRIGTLSRAIAAIGFGVLLTNFAAIGAGFTVLITQINVLTASIAKQTLVMAKNPLFWVGVAAVGAWEYSTRFKRLTDDIEQGLAPISKGERELKKLEAQLSNLEAKRGKPNFDDAQTTTGYGGMTRGVEGSGEKEVEKLKAKIERLKAAMKAAVEDSNFHMGTKNIFQSLEDDLLGGGKDGKLPIATLFDSLKSGMVNVQQVFVNAFNTMSQALTNFAMTGKMNFREFALSVIKDLTQMFIKAAILAPLFKMLGITGGGGGFFGLFNKGKPSAPGGGAGGSGSLANAGSGRDGGFGLGTYGSGMPSNPALKSQPGFWEKVGSWTQPFKEGFGNMFKGSPAKAGTLDEHWGTDSFDWGVTGQKDPYYGPGGGWNPWRDGQPGQFYNFPLGDQSFLGGFGGEIGQLAHGSHPGSPGALRGMFSDASMGDFGAQMNLMKHGYTDFYGKGFGGIYPGETTPGLDRSLSDFGSGNWGHMNWKTPETGFTGAGEGYGSHLRSNFGPYGEGISGGPKFGASVLVGGASIYGAGKLREWFAEQGLIPKFAKGGVVDSPTYSLMGEAGSEAVLPLKRGKDGKLGVVSGGGGGININVDVDAKGTKVQGEGNQASQLGKLIGAAIQAELLKQKRPGGMLSAA